MAAERKEWLELNPQYITNKAGERTAVVLDIEEYHLLLEQLEYEADVEWAERVLAEKAMSDVPSRPWREVRAEIEAERKGE
jgi:hypothetical protein